MMAITSNGVSQSKHLARHHIKITCTRLMHQRVGPALHHLSVRGLPTTIYPHTIRSVIINVQRSPTGELPPHNHWITPNCAQWASAADRNSANNDIPPQIKLGGDGLISGQDGCFFADRLTERVRWSGYTGNNVSHNIVQPYNTVHLYIRIS